MIISALEHTITQWLLSSSYRRYRKKMTAMPTGADDFTKTRHFNKDMLVSRRNWPAVHLRLRSALLRPQDYRPGLPFILSTTVEPCGHLRKPSNQKHNTTLQQQGRREEPNTCYVQWSCLRSCTLLFVAEEVQHLEPFPSQRFSL